MNNLINQLEESEMTDTFGGGWVEQTIDGIEYLIYVAD